MYLRKFIFVIFQILKVFVSVTKYLFYHLGKILAIIISWQIKPWLNFDNKYVFIYIK